MEITYLILNQMFLFLLLKLLKQFQTNLDQAQLKTITMVFLWKQQIDQHPNLILKFRFYLSLLFLMTSQKFYSFEETILLQEFILFHIKFITNAHRFVVSFFFMSETHLPLQWCYAMGFFILKTKPPPLNIKDFQSIALLNVEGKLMRNITNNNLIGTSVQTCYLENVSGCIVRTRLSFFKAGGVNFNYLPHRGNLKN